MCQAESSRLVVAFVCVAVATISGCNDSRSEPGERAQSSVASRDTDWLIATDDGVKQRLLKIAAEYLSYGLVDKQVNWSVVSCIRPPTATVSFSTSDDRSTHGRKLYYLFASDRDAYWIIGDDTPVSPVGQVLVKESWAAEEVETANFLPQQHACGESVVPFAKEADKTYETGEKKELFIMFKADPETPGTDDGWVYGTVTSDGKQVLAAGRLDNCMNCHKESRYDRLLGQRHPFAHSQQE